MSRRMPFCAAWAAWLLAGAATAAAEDPQWSPERARASASRSAPSSSAASSQASRPIPKPSPKLQRPDEDRSSAGSAAGSFWRTMGALFLVLTLILGAAFFLRKHAPASLVGLPLEAIEVLGKRNLDQRQSIVLVRCGSRVMILGSSAAGLTTLSEVSDPVEVDYLVGLCRPKESASPVSRSFRQLLVRTGLATPESRESSSPAAPSETHSEILSGEFAAQTPDPSHPPLERAHG